jgi:hypothetical protein
MKRKADYTWTLCGPCAVMSASMAASTALTIAPDWLSREVRFVDRFEGNSSISEPGAQVNVTLCQGRVSILGNGTCVSADLHYTEIVV